MACAVAWLLTTGVVAGGLLAPWVHGALVRAGRQFPGLAELRDLEFERVISRCVLAVVVLGLIPMLRMSGVRRREAVGLGGGGSGYRDLASGGGAGALAVLLLTATGWLAGVYEPAESISLSWASSLLPGLVAALAIATFEEVLFRGALFGGLRPVIGGGAAAVVCSAVFALVHIATPEPTVGIAHAHWSAGLELLPDMFRMVHGGAFYLPYVGSLFLMGVALCAMYVWRGSIWMGIGLHAGMIWMWLWVPRVLAPAQQSGLGDGSGPSGLVKSHSVFLCMLGLAVALALLAANQRGGKSCSA